MPDTSERIIGQESVVKVAAIQMEPRICKREENLEKSLSMLKQGVDMGAELIVLPELSNTGFVFNSRREAFSQAEEIPNGPTCKGWMAIAKEKDVYIAGGLAEREGSCVYNSAVLLGPDGFIGKYRKLHEWSIGKIFLDPGDLGLPVFSLPFGRVGLIVCYDGWFPEVIRILAMKGADIILDPTNWVDGPPEFHDEIQALKVHFANAFVNTVHMVCADRVGTERGVGFKGRSVIIECTGRFLAGPASATEEEIIVADVNITQSRNKNWSDFNHILHDRRADVFDPMLGYTDL